MDKVKENDFYQWSVEKGDYKRDQESTISYMKKRIFIRRIKKSLWILLYLSVISIFTYFAISFF